MIRTLTSSSKPGLEIKATYGNSAFGIRATSHEAAAALIVLKLSKDPEEEHEIVFNSPLEALADVAGPLQKNGQATVRLSHLRTLNEHIRASDRVARRT